MWVRPWLLQREETGAYHNIMGELAELLISPYKENSKGQQKQSSNFSIKRQKRGQAAQRMPGDDPG